MWSRRPKPAPALSPDDLQRYRRIRAVALLIDAAFRLPGTRFRFGLNSLLGAVPGGGDAVLALISLYLVAESAKLGVSRPALARMGRNVAIEFLLGTVPVAGDLFDVVWRANLRNLKILEDELGPVTPR